jgi:hypothetical protein
MLINYSEGGLGWWRRATMAIKSQATKEALNIQHNMWMAVVCAKCKNEIEFFNIFFLLSHHLTVSHLLFLLLAKRVRKLNWSKKFSVVLERVISWSLRNNLFYVGLMLIWKKIKNRETHDVWAELEYIYIRYFSRAVMRTGCVFRHRLSDLLTSSHIVKIFSYFLMILITIKIYRFINFFDGCIFSFLYNRWRWKKS